MSYLPPYICARNVLACGRSEPRPWPRIIYDLIVIGSGPGGASLAYRLASTGKRILVLERGDYLPRSQNNWNSQVVFVDAAYQAKETWTNAAGDTFSPGLHYYVGGNSKVYGAALLRLREQDFGEVRMPAAFRRHGRSATQHLSLIIPRRSGCFTFMVNVERTPWNLRPAFHIPIRR